MTTVAVIVIEDQIVIGEGQLTEQHPRGRGGQVLGYESQDPVVEVQPHTEVGVSFREDHNVLGLRFVGVRVRAGRYQRDDLNTVATNLLHQISDRRERGDDRQHRPLSRVWLFLRCLGLVGIDRLVSLLRRVLACTADENEGGADGNQEQVAKGAEARVRKHE